MRLGPPVVGDEPSDISGARLHSWSFWELSFTA